MEFYFNELNTIATINAVGQRMPQQKILPELPKFQSSKDEIFRLKTELLCAQDELKVVYAMLSEERRVAAQSLEELRLELARTQAERGQATADYEKLHLQLADQDKLISDFQEQVQVLTADNAQLQQNVVQLQCQMKEFVANSRLCEEKMRKISSLEMENMQLQMDTTLADYQREMDVLRVERETTQVFIDQWKAERAIVDQLKSNIQNIKKKFRSYIAISQENRQAEECRVYHIRCKYESIIQRLRNTQSNHRD